MYNIYLYIYIYIFILCTSYIGSNSRNMLFDLNSQNM